MAHNVETMMLNSKKGASWHGLENLVDGLQTTRQAIIEAGLDWTVSKEPMFVHSTSPFDGEVEAFQVPDAFAMVRNSDKAILGVTGNRYTPVQNADAFEFFDRIVGEGEAIIESAGSLRGGQLVWLLAEMPVHMRIEGISNDIIRPYVLLSNSHDGKTSVNLALTMVRVVCNNTLNLAMSDAMKKVSIRHTKTVSSKMDKAAQTLGLINSVTAEVSAIFNAMAKKQVNTEDMKAYFESVFGKESTQAKNKIDDAFRLVESGQGTELVGVRGSLWGAFNAVTELIDHETDGRGNTEQLDRILFGSGANIKGNAFDKAFALLN